MPWQGLEATGIPSQAIVQGHWRQAWQGGGAAPIPLPHPCPLLRGAHWLQPLWVKVVATLHSWQEQESQSKPHGSEAVWKGGAQKNTATGSDPPCRALAPSRH